MGTAVLIGAGALLGAIFGSFIATLAIRWPRGESVARGRSACDGCGASISAAGLVPILSYAVQRGRTRCCRTAIDPLHVTGEVLGAVVGAMSVALAPDLPSAVAGAVFGWLLIALALLDARHYWLPDKLTGALALAGFLAGVAGLTPALEDRLIGGAVGLLSFAGVRLFYRQLRGREGMGAGDVKLFGAIGLWLGWHMLPAVLLGAALAGLLWAALLVARGRGLTGTSKLPFGLFLALAAWGGWIALARA